MTSTAISIYWRGLNLAKFANPIIKVVDADVDHRLSIADDLGNLRDRTAALHEFLPVRLVIIELARSLSPVSKTSALSQRGCLLQYACTAMSRVWDFEKALQMLPYLAKRARERGTITYGELGGLIDVFPLYMTKPLDTLRDRILIEHQLPRIDALVVNKDTGEVGDSFYAEGFGSMTMDERRALLDYEREKVYGYPNWDRIIENLRRHYGA